MVSIIAILENNFRLCTSVIPANPHDLSVTTEHESAATESGATDVFRPAGLIRAFRSLPYGQARMSCAHPWHQARGALRWECGTFR